MASSDIPPRFSTIPQYIIRVIPRVIKFTSHEECNMTSGGSIMTVFKFKVIENNKYYYREDDINENGSWILQRVSNRVRVSRNIIVIPGKRDYIRNSEGKINRGVLPDWPASEVPIFVQEAVLTKLKRVIAAVSSKLDFLAVPCLLFVVKIALWNSLESEDDVPIGTPAAKSAIKSLQKLWVSDLSDGLLDSCVICLEGLATTDSKIICMPCKHLFHKSCITNWLNTSNVCPLCRFAIPTDTEKVLEIN